MNRRGIFPPELAELTKQDAGQKYRPSNGTEGEMFHAVYCDECRFWKDPCMIAADVFFYDIDDEDYPVEWQYGPDGQPTCTGFAEVKP